VNPASILLHGVGGWWLPVKPGTPQREYELLSVAHFPDCYLASRSNLEFTYSLIDRIFRLSLGEMGDFSGAKYDRDFSLSLEQAQRRKHDFVAESINIGPGRRIIDLGCGWGPMLNFIRSKGATGVGLTLSSAQAAACRRNGLEARLQDIRTLSRDTFGPFDAAVSLGAFEHFCSPEEFRAGKQDEVYTAIFGRVAEVIPRGGRFFLQTMVFGRNKLPADQVDVNAPRDSDAWYLGLMSKQFPGSWLPYGKDQVTRTAAPYFRLVSAENGRLDYIETIRQWRKRFAAPSLKKSLLKLSLLPRYLASEDFRLAFTSGVSANSVCFERELLDHWRLVFEKA
jgi:cyclopropane-fatty-acyl-phospholipid synthase